MLVTASTVKDTLPHVQRFVRGNLRGGVDHLVVFLDAPEAAGQAEVRAWLGEQEHVTCIATDQGWWAGDRPGQLNVRQRINANLVKAAAVAAGGVDWVLHIDADEIVQADRTVLDAVPAEQQVISLAPMEAVSKKRWDGEPTHFKRLLDKDDLTLLHTLGTIDRPSNGAYFHGHVDGKSGLRPTMDLWLTLHHVVDAERNDQPPYTHDGLRLLHYESYSGEDFVRKWTQILAAGPSVSFRPAREPTAVALRTLIGKGLSPEETEPYLMRIFERTTEDDFDTLLDLGLLVEVDPMAGDHQPSPLPDDGLARVLGALAGQPKRAFHPGNPAAEASRALEQAAGSGTGAIRAARRFLRRS